MKDIAIYGAGGLGREIACLILKINAQKPQWRLIGFFDDAKPIGDPVAHFGPILGGLHQINSWPTPLDLVCCFGDPHSLHHAATHIANPNISFPNIVAPDFEVLDPLTFQLGRGNIICARCSATTNTRIGDFNILNGGVIIGHDVTIRDCNAIMPGVHVSGEVSIGSQNLFGAGSFIKQQLSIGDRVTLSPLSALLTNPKDGNVYIGNPAMKFRF